MNAKRSGERGRRSRCALYANGIMVATCSSRAMLPESSRLHRGKVFITQWCRGVKPRKPFALFSSRANPRALGQARRAFMRAHGRVFWILGIMQHFWYRNDRRRERFVAMCEDRDVQKLIWPAYMNKRLVYARPFAYLRIFAKDMRHLLQSALTRNEPCLAVSDSHCRIGCAGHRLDGRDNHRYRPLVSCSGFSRAGRPRMPHMEWHGRQSMPLPRWPVSTAGSRCAIHANVSG